MAFLTDRKTIFLDLVESTFILVTNQVGSSGSSLLLIRLQRQLVFLVFCVQWVTIFLPIQNKDRQFDKPLENSMLDHASLFRLINV